MSMLLPPQAYAPKNISNLGETAPSHVDVLGQRVLRMCHLLVLLTLRFAPNSSEQ